MEVYLVLMVERLVGEELEGLLLFSLQVLISLSGVAEGLLYHLQFVRIVAGAQVLLFFIVLASNMDEWRLIRSSLGLTGFGIGHVRFIIGLLSIEVLVH